MPSEFETVITDQTEYGTIITNQGAAIIADCILNGTKLPIVEAGAGDGGGAPTAPERLRRRFLDRQPLSTSGGVVRL